MLSRFCWWTDCLLLYVLCFSLFVSFKSTFGPVTERWVSGVVQARLYWQKMKASVSGMLIVLKPDVCIMLIWLERNCEHCMFKMMMRNAVVGCANGTSCMIVKCVRIKFYLLLAECRPTKTKGKVLYIKYDKLATWDIFCRLSFVH